MLRLTRRADYGLRLMIRVAGQRGKITVAEVASEQDIPYQLLRKVAYTLVRKQLLKGERGAGGGVSLSRPASSISLLDIVSAFQSPALNRCTTNPPSCDRRHICAAFPVWVEVQRNLESSLRQITLAYLARRQVELTRSPRHDTSRGITKPARKSDVQRHITPSAAAAAGVRR